jgi:TPR repeat protein
MRARFLFPLFAGLLLAALAATSASALDAAEDAYRRGDHATAFALWKERAERGDILGQFNAAILLDQGRGVGRDRGAAARLYRLAAAQGYARAAFNLAQMLAEGDGVDRDAATAADWYRAAAEAGDMLAQFELGLLLAEGRDGLRPDAAAAARWLARAAAQDHPQALFRLGTMYANGTGVAQDLARATELFERADVALMSDESNTSCTTQRSALRLAQCRRAVPRM